MEAKAAGLFGYLSSDFTQVRKGSEKGGREARHLKPKQGYQGHSGGCHGRYWGESKGDK